MYGAGVRQSKRCHLRREEDNVCKTCIFVDLCGSQKCGDYVGDPWKVDESMELLEGEYARD
ncbi:hypothetical protein AMI01nite_28230 [Aneurinibacillus migulanus]|nr:hypothetical protein AMI01nite_28230 [Aneurinibacillus migulanus]